MKRAALLLPILAVACAGSAAPARDTRVPPAWRQGEFLRAQDISAIDISDDGKQIAVGTMAFRHDRNFWVLSESGEFVWGRHVAPWAPYQVLALDKTYGSGLATSRVTSPHPTIAAFNGEKEPEFVMVDSIGEMGFVRYGAGDWRTGWSASLLGDLFARGPGLAVTVRHHDGSFKLRSDGAREKFPLGNDRPFRMTLSPDGKLLALAPIAASAQKGARAVLSMRDAENGKELWTLKPLEETGTVPKPPQPEDEFATLPEFFDTRPDALVPFRLAASVSIAEGRIALTEYQGWMRVRTKPASGKWDPPYHVIPFIPRQRGVLRVLELNGQEIARSALPVEGLFEVHADTAIWVSPMSWFSRGLSGCAWRPADDGARSVLRYDPEKKQWLPPLDFPDAVSDVAVRRGKAFVSCWDGVVYAVGQGKVETGSPCRLRWSPDGRYAIAGGANGDVWCLEPDAKLKWRKTIPSAELPPLSSPPKPSFEDLPVWQVGRTGQEHAYVGDTWLVKTPKGGFLVDTGGASAIPHTLQRIQAAGVDPKTLSHLVHTHSHGDHSGAGYLWRTMGLQVVAPETAAVALGWLMPTLTDYGVWVPRPVDVPLPLKRPGDEAEVDLGGVKVRAIFVPGHSMDSAIYALELNGRRLVFTGDVGFVDANNSNIVHRCWGDKAKAKVVIGVVKEKVLPFKPDYVFTGHGAHRDGVKFLEELVKRSEAALD
jgi:glyoxylase-like metal-dependent hydrolase (beta-lactamase superfamily II)